MAKVRSGSVRRNIDTSLSNSYSSSAASSLSSSNYGVKTIRVFKNGDPYHQGIKVVLNRRYVHDLDKLLELLSEKFDLTHGVKKLYTSNGKLIRHFQDIEDKQDYVAATNHFIPQFYGKWTNPIGHPFRGVSPVNMPHERSRSQTRSSDDKPIPKKRSQSGVASASTLRTVGSSASSKGTPGPDGKKKKKKIVKKKKKPDEGQPPPPPPPPEAKDEGVVIISMTGEPPKPDTPPKPPGSPEKEATETPESARPESPLPDHGSDDEKKTESEKGSNRTRTPSGSVEGTEDDDEDSQKTDPEEGGPPSPELIPKTNGKAKDSESAKGSDAEKESKED